MYNSFSATPQVTPFNVVKPLIDVNAKNTKEDYGAKASSRMDFHEVDRAPMLFGGRNLPGNSMVSAREACAAMA
jgi:hypothetical protein